MPENEQDQQDAVDLPETVAGAPEWGGVPRDGGDNADATGGPPTDMDAGGDVADADADADAGAEATADADAGGDATADADAGGDATADADAGEEAAADADAGSDATTDPAG